MEQKQILDPEVSPTPAEQRQLYDAFKEGFNASEQMGSLFSVTDAWLVSVTRQKLLAGVVPHAPQKSTEK